MRQIALTMINPDKTYYKQEKVFRMLFVVLIIALGIVFYNAFLSRSSTAAPSSALLPASAKLLGGPVCVLNKQQKSTVDNLMPSLCCMNPKKYKQ